MFNPTAYQSAFFDLYIDEILLLYQDPLTGIFIVRFKDAYHILLSDGHLFRLYDICSNCAGHIRMIKLDAEANRICQVCGSQYGRKVLN